MKDVETRVNLKRIVSHSRISKVYNKKLIAYGDIIDILQYRETKITFKHDENSTRKGFKNNETGNRRSDSIARTRQNIYRITHCNCFQHGQFQPIFFTITFAENITSLQFANHEFKKFMKRLNYRIGHKLKYLFVPEFQKRGAVHYHGVFFNLPFIDKREIEDIWGHGYTRIETIKKIKDVGAYIAKYLGKETFDNRLFGQRILLTSRGLFRPIELYGSQDVDNYVSNAKILEVLIQKAGETYSFTKLKTELCQKI